MSDSADNDTVKISKWFIGLAVMLVCSALGTIGAVWKSSLSQAQDSERMSQKQDYQSQRSAQRLDALAQSFAEFKAEMKEGTKDRYTAAQAAIDAATTARLYDGLEKRIAMNELRLRELEKEKRP